MRECVGQGSTGRSVWESRTHPSCCVMKVEGLNTEENQVLFWLWWIVNHKTGLYLGNKSTGEMRKCAMNLSYVCEALELNPSCKKVHPIREARGDQQNPRGQGRGCGCCKTSICLEDRRTEKSFFPGQSQGGDVLGKLGTRHCWREQAELVLLFGSRKGSCVEGLVPNADMFKGGTFGKKLEHEGSVLINGLNHRGFLNE